MKTIILTAGLSESAARSRSSTSRLSHGHLAATVSRRLLRGLGAFVQHVQQDFLNVKAVVFQRKVVLVVAKGLLYLHCHLFLRWATTAMRGALARTIE